MLWHSGLSHLFIADLGDGLRVRFFPSSISAALWVEKDARIAVNHGPTFGAGGETFLRFNIAMPRARVAEAVERLRSAFADLQ